MSQVERARWVVYCDESREGFVDRSGYLGIGGLWVRAQDRDAVKWELREIASSHGLNAELKWQKVSARTLDGYSAFATAFARLPVFFRALLVEKSTVDLDGYHGGDGDLGFYKFYFRMLEKWLDSTSEYVVLLDRKPSRTKGHHTRLREVLCNAAMSSSHIAQLAPVDSRESSLSQLADVLTGAVTAAWSGTPPGSAKEQLQSHLAAALGLKTIRIQSQSPGFSKFNVFRMDLAGRAARQP